MRIYKLTLNDKELGHVISRDLALSCIKTTYSNMNCTYKHSINSIEVIHKEGSIDTILLWPIDLIETPDHL